MNKGYDFRVGQLVEFPDKDGFGVVGTIAELNDKTAIVVTDNGEKRVAYPKLDVVKGRPSIW